MAFPWAAAGITLGSQLLGSLLNRGNDKAARSAMKGQLELARQQQAMQAKQFNQVDFPFRKLASALMAQRANRGMPRFLPGQRQASNPYMNRTAVRRLPQAQAPGSLQPHSGPPSQQQRMPRVPQNLAAALMAARQQQRPHPQRLGLRAGQSILPRR